MSKSSASKGPKYYVVWQGRKPGIYLTWDDCRAQTEGFAGARFKSFANRIEAERALAAPPTSKPRPAGATTGAPRTARKAAGPSSPKAITGKGPVLPALVVDAAWNATTKVMEYQGVHLPAPGQGTPERLFLKGPYAGGTNNVGEYLAIVHALALQARQGTTLPIYTDSITALAWVRARAHRSTLEPTEANAPLFELLARADAYLKANPPTVPILKWETRRWGENPADFGRK